MFNNLNLKQSKQNNPSKEKGVLKFVLGLIILLKNTSILFSRNQNDIKQLYIYQNKLIVSIHLSQMKQFLLKLCALPTLSNIFWTVLDETLQKGLVIKRISPMENS